MNFAVPVSICRVKPSGSPIGILDQDMLHDRVNALRGGYDVVYVPVVIFEQLPVPRLNLLVIACQPGLEPESLMNENDRNLRFRSFSDLGEKEK